MERKEILEKAAEIVCKDREKAYGSPEDNFGMIAAMWSDYTGGKITGQDVACMMALLKIARIKSGNGKDDNWIDLAGYAACGGGLRAPEPHSVVGEINAWGEEE